MLRISLIRLIKNFLSKITRKVINFIQNIDLNQPKRNIMKLKRRYALKGAQMLR